MREDICFVDLYSVPGPLEKSECPMTSWELRNPTSGITLREAAPAISHKGFIKISYSGFT